MSDTAANHPHIDGEARLLIGGKLVDAQGGETFENIDPTTGEVLGITADGTSKHMDLAIDAARKAFDETGWATDRGFRSKCLSQLHEGSMSLLVPSAVMP